MVSSTLFLPATPFPNIRIKRSGRTNSCKLSIVRIRISLAQGLYGKEDALVCTLYVGCIQPTAYFQVVANADASCYISLSANRNVAADAHVTIYLCRLY